MLHVYASFCFMYIVCLYSENIYYLRYRFLNAERRLSCWWINLRIFDQRLVQIKYMTGTMSCTSFICSFDNFSIYVYVQAQDFRVQGTKMKSKMWLQNMKMKLIVVAIVGLIILIIVLTICHGKCD